ncbi:MAG: hypothetical protein RL329_3685 [Bacteroidota bacterium]|jgi:hypothetical protein
MKIFQKSILLSAAVGMIAAVWSCGTDSYLPSPETARIRFFHGVSDLATASVSVDGARLGFLSTAIQDTFRYKRAYPVVTDSVYMSVPIGARNVKITAANGTTLLNESNVSVEKGKSYSVFATDTAGKVGSIILQDVIGAPKTNVAIVRVLNLIVNQPSVDVSFSSGGFTFPAVANKTGSAFTDIKIDTAAQKVNLRVLKGGTTTSMLALNAQTLVSGRAYTLVLTGIADSTGAKVVAGTWLPHAR